jgi:arabinofuranosyltransferase
MGDDAHITFRAVWNLVHGFGLTFNPDERVQAFTHPLWALVITPAYFITREFLFTVTAVSWVFDVAAGVILLRRARTPSAALVTVAWLLSSKALVDYSSSGLEYPLSYFLLALFCVPYLERRTDVAPAVPELRWSLLVASLAFVNRPDTVLLFAIPVGEMTLRAFRARAAGTLRAVLIGVAPAVAWLAFATFYYGFPLPNTYYAKVANGVPAWLQRQQGFAYLLNSIRFDPITIGTMALAVLVAWRANRAVRLTAVSSLLYVAYTVNVGGDFMSGRFFAMPFLIAVAALVPSIEGAGVRWLAGGLVLYNLVAPVAPIKTSPLTVREDGAWPWRTQNGIKDEQGITLGGSNLLSYAPFHAIPDSQFARDGIDFSASPQHASVYCCIGLYGLNAGPSKHVIDENALSDPLLARLPVSPRVYFDFWASHYFRDLPAGYVESNERDQNLLTDPLLHDYYDRLRNVTRGPLLRMSRLRDMAALNFGRYRGLSAMYEKRRPIQLSIRADHARFVSDVGDRDPAAGTLRTTGRGGYLQRGPGIPLKAGAYRVQWLGATEAGPGTSLGFVEVWNGNTRIGHLPVSTGGGGDRRLAQIDFTIPEDVRRIEYRFWVNGGIGVTLERVELYSAAVLPGQS